MQFFMRNPNMLLVLKSERLKMNYHRFFEKSGFFLKKCKKAKKVFDLYFYKNTFELGKIYYQNDQRKKLYKPWKFQWIWTWSPDQHGEIPWIYPLFKIDITKVIDLQFFRYSEVILRRVLSNKTRIY